MPYKVHPDVLLLEPIRKIERARPEFVKKWSVQSDWGNGRAPWIVCHDFGWIAIGFPSRRLAAGFLSHIRKAVGL